MRRREWQRGLWVVVLLEVLSGRSAPSQVLVGLLAGGALASETFGIGFDIGMNFATLTGLGDASRKNAPMFGLFADWRFSEHVHFNAGLIPLSSRGADALEPVPLGDPTLDNLVSGGTMSRTISTFDVPLLLKFAPRRDVGPRVGVGPQIAFVMGANDRYTATSPDGAAVVLEENIEDRLANIDAGIAVDLEWRWPLLAIGVRYYHGLTDLLGDTPEGPSRSRVLSGSGRIPLGRSARKGRK